MGKRGPKPGSEAALVAAQKRRAVWADPERRAKASEISKAMWGSTARAEAAAASRRGWQMRRAREETAHFSSPDGADPS